MFWLPRFQIIHPTTYLAINTLSLIFHFSFLSYFILRVIPNINNWRYYKKYHLIVSISVALVIIYDLNRNSFSLSFTLSNFILFILCLIYFTFLLESHSINPILKSSIFWVVIGIFICTGISLPVNIINDHILKNGKDLISDDNKRLMGSIGVIPYALMHLCFTKAYWCDLRKITK